MSTAIENKEFWERQLEAFKVSGLSRAKYCRNHDINYLKFGYWIKKLNPASAKWIPVKVQTPAPIPYNMTLCTLELQGHFLKIHDLSVLSFILERLT